MGLLLKSLVRRFLSTIPLFHPWYIPNSCMSISRGLQQVQVAVPRVVSRPSDIEISCEKISIRRAMISIPLSPTPTENVLPAPWGSCLPSLPSISFLPRFSAEVQGAIPEEGEGRAFGDPFSQGSTRLFEAIVGAARSTCRRALLHVCAHVAFARALQRRRVRLQGRRNVQTKLENLVRPFAWTETCPRRRTKRGKPTTKQPSRDTWCNERGLRLEQQTKGG